MARKFGKVNQMSTKFEDYSYIINGVGGIGKTSLVYEIGKLKTGSDEGTFIITCGGENAPKHIPNAFYEKAPNFKTLLAIVKELCDNKAEYPNTKFVAIDSLDEYARIAENFVVAEWNASCDLQDRAKSIKQAYKGFQGGENRACEVMINPIIKLQKAGYSILEVGHTKEKDKESAVSGIKFKQLTCNLDNKYYALLKDKVNLIAMCYFEDIIENVEDRKNPFTKKMEKAGKFVQTHRVMVFNDDEKKSIDTKTHFEYIDPKIEFGAKNFIDAVENAIAKKIEVTNANGGAIIHPEPRIKFEEDDEVSAPVPTPEPDRNSTEEPTDQPDAPPFDTTEPEDIFAEDTEEEESVAEPLDVDAALTSIRAAFKSTDAGTKKQVKTLLADHGGKLSASVPEKVLREIMQVLDI